MRPRALVVSNTGDLVESIRIGLGLAGFEVITADNAFDGLKRFYDRHPGIVIMEDTMCSAGTVDLCSHIQWTGHIPLILIGNPDGEGSLVEGLQRGADFYMRRPVGMAELVARARTLLRRSHGWQERVRRLLNADERCAWVDGRCVSLTATEFRLLTYMALNAGRVVPAEEFITRVWAGDQVGPSTLGFYIFRLRQKLDHSVPHNIFTHHGMGYRFGEEGREGNAAPAEGSHAADPAGWPDD